MAGKITITPSLFFKHAACPHWNWYDTYGDERKKGDVPELMQKLLDQGVIHEEEYVKGMDCEQVETRDWMHAVDQTRALMEQGVDCIYQGVIEHEIDGVLWRGKPDLLEKRKGTSDFGNYYYEPVDIKSSHSLKPEQALQLTFYALLLKEVQGVRPTQAAIINVDHERIDLVIEPGHIKRTKDRIADLVRILGGDKPAPKLGSKCKLSPWYSQCIAQAEETNDIALLYNLHQSSMNALRANGIKTVEDAAKMDTNALPKIAFAGKKKLDKLKLQAQSLLDGELRWLKRPFVPDAPLKLFFDIEGDPLLDVQYLFGFWVVGDPERQYAKFGEVHTHPKEEKYFIYFLAEQPEDEERMWEDFLRWVDLLPEAYKVYHFADYERARTLQMAMQYRGSTAFDHFVQQYVDLSVIVQESVIFPLYFYSIKDIAKSKFLNYKWRHQKAGGAQSIFWYEEWLETGDRKILQDIIDYNEDDVVATEYLFDWLKSHANTDPRG